MLFFYFKFSRRVLFWEAVMVVACNGLAERALHFVFLSVYFTFRGGFLRFPGFALVPFFSLRAVFEVFLSQSF